MTRQQTALAVAAGLLLLVFGWLWLSPEDDGGEPARASEAPAARVIEGEALTVRLYFPGSGAQLVVEEREIAVATGATLLEGLAAELLAGPTDATLFAPFPEGTEAGSVFISEGGIAFVDLVSTRPNPPPSGSRAEMLSVYSIVNTLEAGLPELQGVVLLWNGQQRPSFAGHLDTGRPLTANPELVAG